MSDSFALHRPATNRVIDFYCDETGIHRDHGRYMVHGALILENNDTSLIRAAAATLCDKYGVSELKGSSKAVDKWEAIETLYVVAQAFCKGISLQIIEKDIMPYIDVLGAAYATLPKGYRPDWQQISPLLSRNIGPGPFKDFYESLSVGSERDHAVRLERLVSLLSTRIDNKSSIHISNALHGLYLRVCDGARKAGMSRKSYIKRYSTYGLTLNSIVGLQNRMAYSENAVVNVWHDEQSEYAPGLRHSIKNGAIFFDSHKFYAELGRFEFIESSDYPEVQLIDMIIWSVRRSLEKDDQKSLRRLQNIIKHNLSVTYIR